MRRRLQISKNIMCECIGVNVSGGTKGEINERTSGRLKSGDADFGTLMCALRKLFTGVGLCYYIIKC